MKEIKLKPTLVVGEEIIYQNKKITLKKNTQDKWIGYYKNGDQVMLGYLALDFDIIESPAECDHYWAKDGKCIKCQLDSTFEKPKLDFEIFEERLMNKINKKIQDKGYHFRDTKEMIDEAASTGKPIIIDAQGKAEGHSHIDTDLGRIYAPKENPQLKLRVGGVYRNEKDELRRINRKDIQEYFCDDQYKECFTDRGNGLVKDTLRAYDLIEEVAAEKVEYCDCEYTKRQTELKGWQIREKICHLCNKPVDNSPNSRLLVSAYEDFLFKAMETQCKELKKLHFDNPFKNLEQLYNDVKCAVMDVNYGLKFCECGRRIFYDDDKCLLCEYQKPTGNPFKVGDTVIVYDFIQMPVAIVIALNERRDHTISVQFQDGSIKDFHYKQCELVEK